MKEEMRLFNFYVDFVIKSSLDHDFKGGCLPFTVKGTSYEEARAQALEFAQSIARGYSNNDFEDFYFRIIKA